MSETPGQEEELPLNGIPPLDPDGRPFLQTVDLPPKTNFTPEQKAAAEAEIAANERIVDYDTKEYPIEVLVNKYVMGLETDTNDIYVPDYQREFTWGAERQSKFIESVLIGLPIPYVFVADVQEREAG